MQKTKSFLLYMLVALMPLHTMLVDRILGSTPFGMGGFLNLWRDFIIITLLILSIIKKQSIRLNRHIISIFITMFIILIYAIISDVQIRLKWNIARMYVVPMFMILVMQQIKINTNDFRNLVKLLFMQGVALSLFGYFQTFILGQQFLLSNGYGSNGVLHHSFYISGWYGFQRVVSTFSSPNNCALYLLQCFVISYSNREIFKNWKWAGVGFGIIALGIIGTFSRTVWVALIIYYFIYTFYIEKRKFKLIYLYRLLCLPLIIGVLIYIDNKFLNGRMFNMVSDSIMNTLNKTDASFLKHLEDLFLPIMDVATHPFGYGFGKNGPIALSVLGSSSVNLVESSVWLAAYDIGILGIIVYFYPYLSYSFRLLIKKKPDILLVTIGMLSISTFLCFCLLPYHQNIEATFLVYLFLGASMNPYLREGLNRQENNNECIR